jgi:magnesium transporter
VAEEVRIEQPTVEADAVSVPGGLGVAAEHAAPNVPTGRAEEPAGEVRERIAGTHFDCADDLAVLDGDRLLGIVSIEHLLAAPAAATLASLMDREPTVVGPGVDQEVVAHRMVRHGEASIAVVDSKGRFRGLIPPHAMLGVLLAEHEEDLARLGGFLAGSERARSAAEERISRRLWHRLPWLALGLLGSMVTAVIVSAFEDQLRVEVLLAVFIPAVVYLADAVGTQTEAVLIRGLAVGIDFRKTVRREIGSGLIAGAIIGAVFTLFILAGWGDGSVALAVGISLLAACGVASVIAMVLPWTFQRLGSDPAFGSGPLATVLQDLISVAVYLVIGTAIVL